MVVLSRSFWIAVVAALALTLPTTAFAQATRTVDINSVPQGATVRLDSESANPLGTTPLRRVRIRSGSHTLFFTRDGFIPGSIQINVTRSRETFSATLVQGGSIYVSADVDGAQVFLDGNAVGTTPGRINNVQPGQHVVEIRQTGMQTFRDTVTVGAGAVASVNATLRPPPPQTPPTGVVRVIVSNPNGPVPADLQVTFDGAPMTGQPPSNEAAPPGQHIVQISANGFRSIRREVNVTAGQTYALAVDLDPIQTAPTGGSVRVIVPTAGAQVFLDGELMNATAGAPAARENVPPGQHSLRITAPGRQTVTRDITVTAGQTTAIEIPDLTAVAQVGRLTVRSPTPNVTVFIDGRNMGPSPYSRDDMPAGQYNITLRAQGFDDRNETCTVSTTQACDVNVPLSRSIGRATLHVELSRPVPGAVVLIDNNAIGEIGAGRDIPNVSAENHEIRVRAEGYNDYVESVTFQENEQHRTLVTLRRSRRGPSGAELAVRRAAISTWGASPLARGDFALDLYGSYGDYVAGLRGTTGLLAFGAGAIDAGFGVRTMGSLWELEVRARAAYRLADGLFGLGAEISPFAGLGFAGTSTFGVRGFALASIHTLGPSEDSEPESGDDPNERSNRLGSFAFSVGFGFEAMSDGLSGLVRYWGDPNTMRPTTQPNFAACDAPAMGMMGQPDPCHLNPGMGMATSMTRTNGDVVLTGGSQGLVRALFRASIEFGLGRHVNLFVVLERVIANNADLQIQRAYYEQFWNFIGHEGRNDSLTYVHLGLTYKF
jgi:hypothetical protein